jgi:ankyrin repeat protein
VSYVASGGSLAMLEALAQFPAVDFNFPDKEGNAPLHFAAQAGKPAVRRTSILSLCQNTLYENSPRRVILSASRRDESQTDRQTKH